MISLIRLLHLEDNPRDAHLIRATLEAEGLNCEIRVVRNREEFEAALINGLFDVILADVSQPHYNGFTALEFARTAAGHVPFILLSGACGEEFADESRKRGATDYILKERLKDLGPAVQRGIREAREKLGQY